jgi:E3 ubiquitin-protein ligase TRIP12
MDTPAESSGRRRGSGSGSGSGKGKEQEQSETQLSRAREREREAERLLGLSFQAAGDGDGDGGSGDEDNESEGGSGLLHQNFTTASSALQGLLRKLGAGLDDLLPSSALSAGVASSSQQVCEDTTLCKNCK